MASLLDFFASFLPQFFDTKRAKKMQDQFAHSDIACNKGKSNIRKIIPAGMGSVETTVIIGGGIIGLSTAYHLAQDSRTTGRKIVVLEALDECFAVASGHNSGLLAFHWFSGELHKLAKYSCHQYRKLQERDPDFKSLCYYRENCLFQARRGSGNLTRDAPRWVELPQDWHLEHDRTTDKFKNSRRCGPGGGERVQQAATM
jgi:glycine/D-amino acid oxidase-like deaminating enzyme